MKEYQFRVPNGVWLDVEAETEYEAVEIVNASLHLLDEPLPAPGDIKRVQVDARELMTRNNIETIYDLETGECVHPSKPVSSAKVTNPAIDYTMCHNDGCLAEKRNCRVSCECEGFTALQVIKPNAKSSGNTPPTQANDSADLSADLVNAIKKDIQAIAKIYPSAFILYDEPLDRLARRIAHVDKPNAPMDAKKVQVTDELVKSINTVVDLIKKEYNARYKEEK